MQLLSCLIEKSKQILPIREILFHNVGSVCRTSRHASQSSSSVAVCGAGSGGMALDILANAPLAPAGASPDSPAAGPFPDIPERRKQEVKQKLFQKPQFLKYFI